MNWKYLDQELLKKIPNIVWMYNSISSCVSIYKFRYFTKIYCRSNANIMELIYNLSLYHMATIACGWVQ